MLSISTLPLSDCHEKSFRAEKFSSIMATGEFSNKFLKCSRLAFSSRVRSSTRFSSRRFILRLVVYEIEAKIRLDKTPKSKIRVMYHFRCCWRMVDSFSVITCPWLLMRFCWACSSFCFSATSWFSESRRVEEFLMESSWV